MIPLDAPEPWALSGSIRGQHDLRLAESLFSIGNGAIGWRANLDEGHPFGIHGVVLAGLFERRPLPHDEPDYALPPSGESLVNAQDGRVLRVIVDGHPLDIRDGVVLEHTLHVGFRTGVLTRVVEWEAPSGTAVRVRSQRLVSLAAPDVGGIRFDVQATRGDPELVIESDIDAVRPLPAANDDPEVVRALAAALLPVDRGEAHLLHRTRKSALLVGTAVAHTVSGAAEDGVAVLPDLVRRRWRGRGAIRVDKLVAQGLDRPGGEYALRERLRAALDGAGDWDAMAAAQREALDRLWSAADIEIDGDPALQQAVRYAMFHTVQAAAQAPGVIPAKGLTGPGYDGHSFWETELFMLPALDRLVPRASAAALRWRQSTLPQARAWARHLRLEGAAHAWRTVDGREASAYWPASIAAFHVNGAVAHAAVAHARATGDAAFERETAIELVVEAARLFVSLGHWRDGAFHIDGVTGPDEYSALGDDNVYTNLIAAQTFTEAAALVDRHPDRAADLGVTPDEPLAWVRAGAGMHVPFDAGLGVHPQSAQFLRHEPWDFAAMGEDDYPAQEHWPYFELYRRQIVKQPDLVLALLLFPDRFTDAQRRADFAYYEAITTRDSSLAASTSAAVAAQLGHLDLAADYLEETAFIDLDDLHGSADVGLHLASLTGVWIAVAAGFGGLRHSDADELALAPRLPARWGRLSFGMRMAGGVLRVTVHADRVAYRLDGGAGVGIRHHDGDVVQLQPGHDIELPTPPLPDPGPAPRQPPERSPTQLLARRRRDDGS